MIYQILEMVEPHQLEKKESINGRPYSIRRSVLQPVAVFGVTSFHTSMENAVEEIKKHGGIFVNRTFTILPVISFDINGNER